MAATVRAGIVDVMKAHHGVLLTVALLASPALADSGGGGPRLDAPPATSCADGDDQPHIAHISVSEGEGDLEIVDIRISGKNANAFSSMSFDIPGARATTVPMTKTSGSNGNSSGNNGTSLWTIEIDLDPHADADDNVTVELRPSCCYIPGAIVVRSKSR